MTSIFSFKVEMLIHVVGEDADSARNQLDQHGGYVGAREVELVKTIEFAKSKPIEVAGSPTLTVVE